MPFEIGNDLGKRSRWFDGALRRAIAQDDGKRLRRAAETLLTKAAKGEPWAIALLADRLDGRVLPMAPDQGDGTLVVSWVMHGAVPQTIDATPSTSERSLSSGAAPALEGAPAERALTNNETHSHLEMGEGVGGGGGTPIHTLETPVTPAPEYSSTNRRPTARAKAGAK